MLKWSSSRAICSSVNLVSGRSGIAGQTSSVRFYGSLLSGCIRICFLGCADIQRDELARLSGSGAGDDPGRSLPGLQVCICQV